MTDRMTAEERHRCMAAIKGKDTKPEIMVRKYLFSRGLRYRVNVKKLPGSPDIVLKKYGVAIFIDGCFWHGHKDCKYYKLPLTNVDYWKAKIARNMARDYVNNVDLELAGWRVFRLWECEIKTKAQREVTLEELYKKIVSGENIRKPKKIRNIKKRQYDDYPDDFTYAAEGE
ncbi:MAG: very short patch repair endonuclease, partial [Muribaculaceae bacterium]|nr:very short patch repair endonuclease [Muribaculaceae bacterium]